MCNNNEKGDNEPNNKMIMICERPMMYWLKITIKINKKEYMRAWQDMAKICYNN